MSYCVLGTGPGGELWTETADTAEVALEIARCMDCDGGHSLKVMTPEHDVFDPDLFEALTRSASKDTSNRAIAAPIPTH
ncbi:hypothetical protein [Amorphus sp. 3PC139-8]|uniref:hypothetical protein n=1 Tax=Amorphus sp. 3PC139-8 TaxID=2735676 RepID=UPI00345CA6AF